MEQVHGNLREALSSLQDREGALPLDDAQMNRCGSAYGIDGAEPSDEKLSGCGDQKYLKSKIDADRMESPQ